MGKIVFSDIDGTLLNSQLAITPLTRGAIGQLQERGIPFVLCSGRGPGGIYPIQQAYDLQCPMIAYGGALILDEQGKELYHRGIPKAEAAKILTFIEEKEPQVLWSVLAREQWIVKDRSDPLVIREEKLVQAAATEGDLDSINGALVSKLLCICPPEALSGIVDRLREAFPAYTIVPSSHYHIDILAEGVTKGAAIEALCGMWDIPLSDTVAFGDNYNDTQMLETVGTGILMGNAPAPLKARFPHHTEDNDNDGIYHAMLRMELISG